MDTNPTTMWATPMYGLEPWNIRSYVYIDVHTCVSKCVQTPTDMCGDMCTYMRVNIYRHVCEHVYRCVTCV